MDVLEPIFIIRDALRGDWLGAGLGLADLGLGPLIDGIKSIRNAARGLDNAPEMVRRVEDAARQIDEIESSNISTMAQIYSRVQPIEPIAIRFADAEQAQDYLRTQYGITANFSGADIRNINLAIDEIDEFAREFPTVAGDVANDFDAIRFGTSGAAWNNPNVWSGYGGSMTIQGNSLTFDFNNQKWAWEAPVSVVSAYEPADLIDEILAISRNIPESFPTYSVAAAVRHEQGHLIERWIKSRNAQYHKWLRDFVMENENILKMISPASIGYHKTRQASEFIAESFAARKFLPEELANNPVVVAYLEEFNALLETTIRTIEREGLTNQFGYNLYGN